MCTHPWTYKVKQYQELENKCETLKHAWHLCLQAVPVLTTSHTTICCWNKQTNNINKNVFPCFGTIEGRTQQGGSFNTGRKYFLVFLVMDRTWGKEIHLRLAAAQEAARADQPSCKRRAFLSKRPSENSAVSLCSLRAVRCLQWCLWPSVWGWI